jgi:hypothetical protein
MLFMVLHYPGRSGGNADGNKLLLQMLQLNFMYIKLFESYKYQIFVDDKLFTLK